MTLSAVIVKQCCSLVCCVGVVFKQHSGFVLPKRCKVQVQVQNAQFVKSVQVHKLRQEKDVLESKLKEFERSLQKLKDCTYQEATQKREYERRVQSVQADLRGANLREQVCLACSYSGCA